MELLFKLVLFSYILITKKVLGEEFCNLDKKSCKCVYDDGNGYDLTGITEPSYLSAKDYSNGSYYLHLCGDSKEVPTREKKDECSIPGYSLCTLHNGTYSLLGQWANVVSNSGDGGLLLTFSKNNSITATLLLVCTEYSRETKLFFNDNSTNQPHLMLYSSQVCPKLIIEPHSYGFFSTLFIILITVSFAYLIIGVFARYFLIGARGLEVIPNLEFWQKLGRTISLGVLYIKNGCRVIPREDSYDAI